MIKFTATANENIIKQLCFHTNLPYDVINKKLREKQVMINGVRTKGGSVCEGDEVVIFAQDVKQTLKIVFEDNNILCIVKPQGIETIGNGGAQKLLEENHNYIKALHRLDRNTEGLVLFAKNKNAYESLKEMMKLGKSKKTYLANVFYNKEFTPKYYTAYLYKNSKESFVKIYNEEKSNCVPIKTFVRTLKQNGPVQTVECVVSNAKTHQIRAHLAHLGAPIVGDQKYGNASLNKKYKIKQQELYAIKIETNFSGEFAYINNLNLSYQPKEKF